MKAMKNNKAAGPDGIPPRSTKDRLFHHGNYAAAPSAEHRSEDSQMTGKTDYY
ncbi:hypothetical protein DPMN_160679 [Dreissena polymorpha]|uniref:Uncharacterized protein n=1 Tax=Dreissena polymorpha TaxID=45954 RepID=A0A9D4ERK8_DREPO|nr:hypothetical protein DPMN_160679 [Dreissena polymorpha]